MRAGHVGSQFGRFGPPAALSSDVSCDFTFMHISRFIPLGLLTLLVGCSSATDSRLTKRELRDTRSAVAQQTTSKPLALHQTPSRDVEVTTEAAESFLVRQTADGWKIVSRQAGKWLPPKGL